MGSNYKERKHKGRERRKERQKGRYPSRAFAAIWWIFLGLGLLFVFVTPAISDIYSSYLDGMTVGLLIWSIFLVGNILYTVSYGRKGIRICPNCGKRAFQGRKYCIDCGARIFWVCPKCNIRASKKRDFCESCGQSLKIVTFARQMEFEGLTQEPKEKEPQTPSGVVVTGLLVQFCPACGAEINEDLTHCSICGSPLSHKFT